jgi:hypothetical protein
MAKITPIPNHEAYGVSTDGIVFKGSKQLKTYSDKRGYEAVYLYDGHNNRKYMSVHRLVMFTHSPIDNPSKMTVNHKDGNKKNNDISNLEWMTNLENMRHAFANGIRVNKGDKKGKTYAISHSLLKKLAKEYETTNTSVRKLALKYGVNRATLQYQFNNNLTNIRSIT